MVSICIPYFSTDKINYRQQWNYVFNSWNIDKIYFIGNDIDVDNDIWKNNNAVSSKTIEYISSFDQIQESIAFFSPLNSQGTAGEIDLKDYIHPTDCCYIFGSNDGATFINISCDKVYINTLVNSIYSWCAASIAMYDRQIKNGN